MHREVEVGVGCSRELQFDGRRQQTARDTFHPDRYRVLMAAIVACKAPHFPRKDSAPALETAPPLPLPLTKVGRASLVGQPAAVARQAEENDAAPPTPKASPTMRMTSELPCQRQFPDGEVRG